jgi:1-aminocyclopropane-1-carboxylate deaminase/D-cysteine desulfhydrase-like pyridoxal-dependent ACC family enzyme
MAPRRVSLIQSPTPLHPLPRMSERYGIDLWIKRDDLTGFALGGNKGRKLEYLMAHAQDLGAEVVVSCGSLQSNFIRQLGAAASLLGLTCAAAAMDLPYDEEQGKPTEAHLGAEGGNVLLDQMLGVDLRRYPDGPWERLYDHAEEIAQEYEAAGKPVYRIPIGGSSGLGAYAFYRAGLEAQEQAGEFDYVVTATSSGSTHVGLARAFAETSSKVIGIACDPEPDLADDLRRLEGELRPLVGAGAPLEFNLCFDFVGPGYGIPTEAGRQANLELAKAEGIFLDPVYTQKSFDGLLGLARAGKIGGRVLYWHTGGIPTLFA